MMRMRIFFLMPMNFARNNMKLNLKFVSADQDFKDSLSYSDTVKSYLSF